MDGSFTQSELGAGLTEDFLAFLGVVGLVFDFC